MFHSYWTRFLMDDTPKTLVYSQAVLTTIKEIFCQNSGEEESASHIWLV